MAGHLAAASRSDHQVSAAAVCCLEAVVYLQVAGAVPGGATAVASQDPVSDIRAALQVLAGPSTEVFSTPAVQNAVAAGQAALVDGRDR